MLLVPRRRDFEQLGILSDKILPAEVGELGVGFSKAVNSPVILALSWDSYKAG